MHLKVWGKAILVSGMITAAGILIVSILLFKFRWGDAMLGIPVAAIYGFASFGGGFVIGRKAASRRFLWGLGYGVAFICIMLLISVLVGGGVTGEERGLLIPALLSLGGGMLGGMMS